MDMKRIRRPQQSPTGPGDLESDGGAPKPAADRKSGGRKLRFVLALVSFLMVLPLMLVVSGFHRNPSFDRLRQVTERGHFELNAGLEKEMVGSSKSQKAKLDKLLGGLLASGFDEHSCLSRSQSVLYRKSSSYLLSAYLMQRLRKYEEIHQKCSPSSELYNQTIDQLKAGAGKTSSAKCKYVVWISYSGLGNRILTLASTFLYALLTNRVLLVDRGVDMTDLFCEPFPRASWLLPLDFPLSHFTRFDIHSPNSFGNMLKNKVVINNNLSDDASHGSSPSFVYLHLAHDYSDHDKLFFCEDDHGPLEKIPWLFLRSDNYFVPSLF
ncbi:hypothetical protein HPP92_002044 [Vanilla planifolia]|uniref:Fucosyltransferase n=1 Tax=Vanilla planifolia TaxID=51239 RepID=A0A835SD22_VANPL|nr:hypothetical protein HPP92_002044 [Vanilla planifolia]